MKRRWRRRGEHLRPLHQATGRDLPPHPGGGPGGRPRVPPPSGVAHSAGGVPDHPGVRGPARREPRDDGLGGGDAARAPVRPHRRRHGHDVDELSGLDDRGPAVRRRPEHRRGRTRLAVRAANAKRPEGGHPVGASASEISTTDQLLKAEEYRPLLVAYRNGAPVRVSDVAEVADSVEDVRTAGLANGKPAVLLIIFRQPGANIIATVDRVRALLPQLRASILGAVDLSVVLDRTTTIRASIRDVEIALMISIALVILVVFVFLRNAWATAIPGVVVPLSLIGTFGVMYLMGYSIDNLSLMALTISTGFVVDDAIVVIENITRHLEHGLRPLAAALRGAREVGFTVLSMSTSLVAVFLPILLMGGIVGRLFREFAVVLSVAVP